MKEIPHGSESYRKLNPHLFGLGAVQAQIAQPKVEPALERESSGRQAHARSVAKSHREYRIAIIIFCHRLFDGDNAIGGAKPLRDAIAASLGMNDSDKRIEWEYSQHRTSGEQGTLVRIEKL